MRSGSRSSGYRLAFALWERARDEGREEEVERSLERVSLVFRSDARLRQLLLHTGIDMDRKLGLIVDVAPPGGAVSDAVRTMIERRTIGLCGHVLRAYRTLRAERSAEVAASVQVAEPLSAREAAEVKESLERTLGRRVKLSIRIRKDLLGGMMIRVGERIIDGTLKGSFDRLERSLGAMSRPFGARRRAGAKGVRA